MIVGLMGWLVVACAGTEPQGDVVTPVEESSVECTVRVAAGEEITPHLEAGAVICLGAGTHKGGLVITQPVTLVGEDGAVIDGGGRDVAVRVSAHGIEVTLKNLGFTGGFWPFGSGVSIDHYAQVTIEDCDFQDNNPGESKVTGLGVNAGKLTLKGSTFGEGQHAMFTTVAEVEVFDTDFGADLGVIDGAKVTVQGGRVAGTLTVRGTTSRKPSLVLDGVDAPNVDNHPTVPGEIEVR